MNKRLFYSTIIFLVIVLMLNLIKSGISGNNNIKERSVDKKHVKKEHVKKDVYIPHDDINAPEIAHVEHDKTVLPPKKLKKYKIIIIVDDFGYGHEKKYDFFKRLKGYKITCSIIPTAYNAKKAEKEAVKYGFKTMLHLPMQAMKMPNRREKAIRVDMTHDEIINILDEDFSVLKHVGGVNNHMGSKATADKRTMLTVLKYLKDKKKFFVDSLTTSKSVVKDICKLLNVPYFKRDIFLDNKGNFDYINKQFEKAKRIAKKRGYVIAIGHVRKETVDFFEKKLPNLDKNYELEFMEDFYKETLKALKNKKNKR